MKGKLYANNIVQLDPKDCGSTVGYSIQQTDWGGFSATVDLSDCSRKISWEFDANDQEKVANVVSIFSAFAYEYENSRADFQRNKRRKKKK